jgi:hypothetical protein
MCYYSEEQKDVISQDAERHDPDRGCKVTVHRTETLDRMVEAFRRTAAGQPGGVVLPHTSVPIGKLLYEHLSSLAKVRRPRMVSIGTVQQETSDYAYVYISTGPDHFAHALNYALIAQSVFRRPDTIEFWRAE